jgi:GntR family transcriptional regulator
MRFELNFKSGKPVYLQLVDQVKAAVASGATRSGDVLPSIRPLAEHLRVNRNTIAKAYTELERQGVITTESGRGCFIADGVSLLQKDARVDLVAQELDQAVVAAHHLQIDKDEFVHLATSRYDAFAERRADTTPPPAVAKD